MADAALDAQAGAGTSPSTTTLCISGGWSARRGGAQGHCLRWRKACRS